MVRYSISRLNQILNLIIKHTILINEVRFLRLETKLSSISELLSRWGGPEIKLLVSSTPAVDIIKRGDVAKVQMIY